MQLKNKILAMLAMVVALGFGSALTAKADSITVSTASGASVADGPVNATAVITVNAGSLTIQLTNNLVNPKSVGQNVSDFFFTAGNLNVVQVGTGTGNEINIAANGTATAGGSNVAAGWILSNGNLGPNGTNGYDLSVLSGNGSAGPAHTLIGPGPYTNANGSIAGNGPHNPFLLGTATFNFTATGLTSVTQLGNFNFSFGTTPGVFVPGTPGNPVPEPATMLLLGTGLAGIGGAIRRRRKGNDAN